MFDDWNIDATLKHRTVEYYNTLWGRRSGIVNMPAVFNMLPAPLKKEVTVDIFWDAMNHSALFKNQDTAFKRALSLEMKSELFLPGNYVFQSKQFKSKMVYVVSGVLQVRVGQR